MCNKFHFDPNYKKQLSVCMEQTSESLNTESKSCRLKVLKQVRLS